MNRRYTVEEYQKAVERIRSTYHYPAITTDVIVGFPEEEECDFEETRKFLKKLPYTKCMFFHILHEKEQ